MFHLEAIRYDFFAGETGLWKEVTSNTRHDGVHVGFHIRFAGNWNTFRQVSVTQNHTVYTPQFTAKIRDICTCTGHKSVFLFLC